ncbi:SDR family oxidoreductase [Lyticum sinuosum]|uniref:Acetoacetyl-CoA reductase-like short-chain reductase n=1 Tax=Lyticum sinuosum TaxID=1332059 RepID=A0AAE4VKJ3_9RICK|nr:SDR family oxidoreductase [Lyticum sinuosum]MDZ5760919.1 putative acetoacetyl-CoA reductase-like short-chain reductase [Lyticum sinuosum]
MPYIVNFKGKNAIVTGGSKGIGKTIAIKMRESGIKVAILYIGNDDVTDLCKNYDIKAIKANVANYSECQKAVAESEEYFGESIDILINNAGITRDKMLHKQEEKGWLDVINVNLISVINMSRCVIEKMREKKYGKIISISSVNANGALGQTNYSASKAGIEGFTKALALENAKLGINVNAIAPGYINTDMVSAIDPTTLEKIKEKIPMGRLGTTEEVAFMAMFLASSNADFITGAVMAVNGGMRM